MLRESKDKRCTGAYLRPNTRGSISYCALGTIYHQSGMPNWDIMFGKFTKAGGLRREQVWKNLGVSNPKKRKICPTCSVVRTMPGLLAHLNDSHEMKWGDIADNLELAQDYDSSKYNKFQNLKNFFFGIDRLKFLNPKT